MKSKSKAKKQAASQSTKKKAPSIKPAWNDNKTDLSRYQLSKVELLQKKVSYSSKNILVAKERVTQVQEQLKQGKFPEAYKDAIKHKQKKIDVKEEYRQKAKAIVYPMRQTRCESAYGCGSRRPIEKLQPDPEEQNNNYEEHEIETDLCSSSNKEKEPITLTKKTTCMAFTSANDPKTLSIMPMAASASDENEAEIEPEEEKTNYLDCDANIKKLTKLKEDMINKSLEMDDCMAGLNAALGFDCGEKSQLPSDTLQLHEAYLDLEPESEPREDLIDAEKYLKAIPDENNKKQDKEEFEENDSSDFERISKLIAQTHKDIDELTAGGNEEKSKASSPGKLSYDQSISCNSISNTSRSEDILKKYENSFMHSRRGFKPTTINVSNKENDMPNAGTRGIISRKITNKTDISLSAAVAPMQVLVNAEYYRASNI